MKTFTVRYIWFKLIKSIELSAINFNAAIIEFNRILPNVNKKHILTIKITK